MLSALEVASAALAKAKLDRHHRLVGGFTPRRGLGSGRRLGLEDLSPTGRVRWAPALSGPSGPLWSTTYTQARNETSSWGGTDNTGIVYQAARNVAAAIALRPQNGLGVFGLIYDVGNPYFSGCGDWPGWPDVLAEALDGHDEIRFRCLSWQQLIALVPVGDDIRAWAREKHGLG
jgi:hypothetical protein